MVVILVAGMGSNDRDYTMIGHKLLQGDSNCDVTEVTIPNQNHWFQECKTGALAEYGAISETMHDSMLQLIADWILKKSKINNV